LIGLNQRRLTGLSDRLFAKEFETAPDSTQDTAYSFRNVA
jgi:hypothetical protein